MTTVKVAACQMPEVWQDVDQALTLMETFLAKADSQHVELVSFPECYLQGYLCDSSHAEALGVSLKSTAFDALLARFTRFRCMFVFGFIEKENGRLFNSAAVVHHGELLGC